MALVLVKQRKRSQDTHAARGLCQKNQQQTATEEGVSEYVQREGKRGSNPHSRRVRPTGIAADQPQQAVCGEAYLAADPLNLLLDRLYFDGIAYPYK